MASGLWLQNLDDPNKGGQFVECSPNAGVYLNQDQKETEPTQVSERDWGTCPNCGAIGNSLHIAKCEKPLTDREKFKIRIIPTVLFWVLLIFSIYKTYQFIVFVCGK